jgi:hypothetical protein
VRLRAHTEAPRNCIIDVGKEPELTHEVRIESNEKTDGSKIVTGLDDRMDIAERVTGRVETS